MFGNVDIMIRFFYFQNDIEKLSCMQEIHLNLNTFNILQNKEFQWGLYPFVENIKCESEVKVLVTQSCLTLCNTMDYSSPGSSVRGIFQARILEWTSIPFSRGSSQPRN